MISGFLFLSWRIFEIIILTPIVGMLGWFVSQYDKANQLTPTYILVLFIVSTLALAWTVFTVISYLRARHDAMFVALVDLAFVGALIAGVYYLRGIAHQNCGNLNAGVTTSGSYFHYNENKTCSMLKASFALGIIAIIAFFVTFCLALLVHHHHRNDNTNRTVVKEYRHGSRHGHRRSGSGSREYRTSRDYGSRDYGSRPRGSSRSNYSSRRQYYV